MYEMLLEFSEERQAQKFFRWLQEAENDPEMGTPKPIAIGYFRESPKWWVRFQMKSSLPYGVGIGISL